MTSFWRAYVLFTGGVIGVGFFGIPYVIVRAGFLPTMVIGAVVLGVVWLVHLLFLDLVLATGGRKRFPGIIGSVLGPAGKTVAAIVNLFGLASALLAYLIIGGAFISLIVSPFISVRPLIASLGYATVAAGVLLWRGRQLFPIQVAILALFGITLCILGIGAGPVLRAANIPLLGTIRDLFLPYGVLLFSFWSLSLMPELADLCRKRRSDVRRVLTWGFLTAAVTYTLFGVLVAAITGFTTTADAFTGLATILPRPLILIGAIFGILTTFDSFLALGLTFANTLTYDFHRSRGVAWIVTLGAPLILLLLGVNQFVTILSLTGAVFLGAEGLLVLIAALRTRANHSSLQRYAIGLIVGATLLLLFGVLQEIVHSVS